MAKKPIYHIIGGGISGLACAWYINKTKKDIQTIVYEASDKLGGRAYSYKDTTMGQNFDNAAHIITGADKYMSKFVAKDEWLSSKYFIDPFEENFFRLIKKNKECGYLKAI